MNMKTIGFSTVLVATGLLATCFVGCAGMSKPTGSISKTAFGTMPDGRPVERYTLKNASGAEASIITYGGIVTELKVPDKTGKNGDVVLGYDSLEQYLKNGQYFGALIGRYGNRIAGGKFSLDGQTYSLPQNNGSNCLHGGNHGFDKVLWTAVPRETKLGPALELTYLCKDGEEGFPGNLKVTAVYTLTTDNALRVDFTATTDKPTVCNLTHHSYFNLTGKGDVLGYNLVIVADRFTPVDANLIPTGELRPVGGTPFDFTSPQKIGTRINDPDEQIQFGHGYDHNWVLSKPAGELGLAARVADPDSGRVMEVFTTEPGIQFYSGNFLGDTAGKGGVTYHYRWALCLEPQHYPDSPNHPAFPSTELKPGRTYKNTIIYRFTVEPGKP
jgi:aldose 1-epimerase